MESLRELFKIGFGPSSSHTMGPQRAASKIKEKYPQATHYEVDLYGSLALTGKGHLTDYIIKKTLGEETLVRFKSDSLPYHPNGMKFYVYQDEQLLDTITAYSIGGGTVEFKGCQLQQTKQVYPHKNLKEIIQYIEDNGISFYDYVLNYEDEYFKAYLFDVLDSMFTCVQNGLHHEGIIPLDQFAANKYPNDILVRLIIKKHPQESVYLSHRNTKTDFPVLTCAVSLGEKEAYAVVGARPSRACRVRLSDQWMEQIKDDEGRKKLADEVTGQMNFGSNMRGSAAYREQLSKVLLRRGFEQLEERREK